MLFADDLAIAARSRAELETKLEAWRKKLEDAGLRISRSKTEHMVINEQGEQSGPLMMAGSALPKVDAFK